MRINVYNEEMTTEVVSFEKVSDNGVRFFGVRLYLKSHEDLHHSDDDDDRSAITWFFHDERSRDQLLEAFHRLHESARGVWESRRTEWALNVINVQHEGGIILRYLEGKVTELRAALEGRNRT